MVICPLDYSHEKNTKSLLEEFSIRHPVETNNFLKEIKANAKYKCLNIIITLDNPPDYESLILTKRQIKRFKKLKLHIHYRRVLIRFMEFYIIGKSPKLIYEFR
jgi:hypothetical protein